jgi:hypothetical protein
MVKTSTARFTITPLLWAEKEGRVMSASVASTVESSLSFQYWRKHFTVEQATNIEELLTPFYRRRQRRDIVIRTDKLLERVDTLLNHDAPKAVRVFNWEDAAEAQPLARHSFDFRLFNEHTCEMRNALTRTQVLAIEEGLSYFVGALEELPAGLPGEASVIAAMANASLAESLLACVYSFVDGEAHIRTKLAPFFQLRKDGCLLCAVTAEDEGIVMLGLPG